MSDLPQSHREGFTVGTFAYVFDLGDKEVYDCGGESPVSQKYVAAGLNRGGYLTPGS